jgi:hypothetical protein
MALTNKIISYEASTWYIKIWRQRWYLYAIFLHIKNFINVELWIDYLLNTLSLNNDNDSNEILTSKWEDIKKHVELSKMYKFSKKYERED